MLLLVILLSWSSSLYCCDDQVAVTVPSPLFARQSSSGSFASDQEADDLCSAAIERLYNKHGVDFKHHILPFFRKLIVETSSSPHEQVPSNVEVLKKVRSGDIRDTDDESVTFICSLMQKATHLALESQKREIEDQRKQLDDSVTNIQSWCRTVGTSIASSLISAAAAGLITASKSGSL